MGIITIQRSESERRAAEMAAAEAFAPVAAEIRRLIPVMRDALPTLRARLFNRPNASGALASLRQCIRDVNKASRGFKSALSTDGVTDDIRYAYNFLESLLGAISSMTGPKAQQEMHHLADHLDKVCDKLERLYADNQAVVNPSGQRTSDGNTPSDDVLLTDEDNVPDSLVELDQDAITQFADLDLNMPGKSSPEVVKTFELPVIAAFNRGVTIDELNSRGFDATYLAGYIMLRRVYILGINTAACQRDGLDENRVLAGCLHKLSEKLNDEMGLVCEKGIRYYKGGWMFYWYGPKGYRHNLLGANVDLFPTSFSFPFGKA